jgi:phosphatidylglycerophosphatase A
MKSAWGVMLDDLVAGFLALVTLGVLGHLPIW